MEIFLDGGEDIGRGGLGVVLLCGNELCRRSE